MNGTSGIQRPFPLKRGCMWSVSEKADPAQGPFTAGNNNGGGGTEPSEGPWRLQRSPTFLERPVSPWRERAGSAPSQGFQLCSHRPPSVQRNGSGQKPKDAGTKETQSRAG